MLVASPAVALFKVYTGQAERLPIKPSIDWFWPAGLDFSTVIRTGLC